MNNQNEIPPEAIKDINEAQDVANAENPYRIMAVNAEKMNLKDLADEYN